MIWVLDISNHQGDFNIAEARREDYSVCICKATEGVTFADGKFNRNIPLIQDSGMVPGAYHFLRSGDGAAQARAFHARVVSRGGPTGWVCACDNEKDASWATTQAFFAEWRRLTGGHPLMMYSGAWWWSPRGWAGSTLTPYLWHSRYVSGTGYGSTLYTRVPSSWWTPGYGGWNRATLLQFTSSAQVAGQRVDVSAFDGSLEDLRVLTGSGDGSPPPGGDDDMAGQTADFAASHVPDPTTGADTGLHMATGAIWAGVNQLLAQHGAPTPITLTDADRAAIASDVASILAPQLRQVAQLADRLGAAGDALGTLNDPGA